MRARSLFCRLLVVGCVAPIFVCSAPNDFGVPEVAKSINALGLDLYREQIKSAEGANVLISPYSISSSLAIAYMGADGETKAEMQKVLRLSADREACGAAFRALADQLAEVVWASEVEVSDMRRHHGDATPIQLSVANRLYAQRGYELRTSFRDELRRHFSSDVAEVDFRIAPAHAREVINQYVASQTHDRIVNLLPVGQPLPGTRIALVNALYLRAGWDRDFEESETVPEPFHVNGAGVADVPTMRGHRIFRYAKRNGYSVIAIHYFMRSLQFVLIVPDALDGLETVEKSLTEEELTTSDSEMREIILHLPKFKVEPEAMSLGEILKGLGLRTAFDLPSGSANFNRMEPRTPDDYLCIDAVLHKTWLTLDEHGTEAAAATAVVMFGMGMGPENPPPPIEVRADRPFMFAIQHVESGVCLFLGRVTDPR